MGFKAVLPSGLGADVKGSIVDEQNNEVGTFASTFAGIGSFFISPEAGKSYKVKYSGKDGLSKTVEVPKAVDGITLQVNNTAVTDVINLRILASNAFLKPTRRSCFTWWGKTVTMWPMAHK